jgi:hypothetical protein
MLRFEGDVFLLGTAIAAPLASIKIATICANSQRDHPAAAAGSSRTAAPIANRAGSARRQGRMQAKPLEVHKEWKESVVHALARTMKRIAVILSLISIVTACNDASEKRVSIPNSDPYIQALRAIMNAQGCASQQVRGANWRPTDEERAAVIRTVEELDLTFTQVEASAAAKGLGDYLASGRESLQRMMAEELNVACSPNEEEAFRNARDAIASFRDHIDRLPAAKR